MATKNEGVPCYDKAAPDEPLFVIRAQDLTGPATIRHWLQLNPQLSSATYNAALEVALAMEKWPNRKMPD